jgi:hypothetical protein
MDTFWVTVIVDVDSGRYYFILPPNSEDAMGEIIACTRRISTIWKCFIGKLTVQGVSSPMQRRRIQTAAMPLRQPPPHSSTFADSYTSRSRAARGNDTRETTTFVPAGLAAYPAKDRKSQ